MSDLLRDHVQRGPADARDRDPNRVGRVRAPGAGDGRRVGPPHDARRACDRLAGSLGIHACARGHPRGHESDRSGCVRGGHGHARRRCPGGKLAAGATGRKGGSVGGAQDGIGLGLQRHPVPSAVQVIHGLHREQDGEVQLGVFFGADQSKIQLVGALQHVLDHLIDRVLVLTGP